MAEGDGHNFWEGEIPHLRTQSVFTFLHWFLDMFLNSFRSSFQSLFQSSFRNNFSNTNRHYSPLLFDRYIRFVLFASMGLILVTLLSWSIYTNPIGRLSHRSQELMQTMSQGTLTVMAGCLVLLGLFFIFLMQPFYTSGSTLGVWRIRHWKKLDRLRSNEPIQQAYRQLASIHRIRLWRRSHTLTNRMAIRSSATIVKTQD